MKVNRLERWISFFAMEVMDESKISIIATDAAPNML